MNPTIKIAISKGRVFESVQPVLAKAGLSPIESFEKSRKLILASEQSNIEIVIVRGADVPVYVAHGAAQLGIVGKDILLEYDGEDVYEPLDLGIARCRLVVAGPKDFQGDSNRIRVATKYVNSARNHFAKQSRQVEIIKLYGSMELAPIVGLADLIIDLTDTGDTLRANQLAILEEVAKISTRLIVNKVAMRLQRDSIQNVVHLLRKSVQ